MARGHPHRSPFVQEVVPGFHSGAGVQIWPCLSFPTSRAKSNMEDFKIILPCVFISS